MNSLAQTAHMLSPLAAEMLFASVWQGVLLTLGVALGLRLLREVAPAVRTWVWMAVLLLLVFLVPLSAMDLFGTHVSVASHGELHVAAGWSMVLLAAWAIGSGMRAIQLGHNAVGLWRLAARAVPVSVDPGLAKLLAGRRQAQLCVSDEVNRPSVAGFTRPRILLPAGLLETLTPAELEHVVLHEMEHLRRYDDWLNLLQQLSLVLLPLNPALLWLDRKLCRERELACDDGVLAATQAHKAYAACLVKLAEESMMRRGVALALSALGTRARESELVARVRRILTRPARTVGVGQTRFAVALLCTATFAAVVALARSPQWVSFDNEAPVLAMGTTEPILSPQAGGARIEPVAMFSQRRSVRPMMTNAVMERPAVRSGGPVASVARRRPRLRIVPIMAGAPVAGGWGPVPVKATLGRSPAARPAMMQPASLARGGASGAHIVVTEFEIAQPLYAAVPWRGGWLIVQL